MVIWNNKENWDGHDCCIALSKEEVMSLVDVLSKLDALPTSAEMVLDALRGYLDTFRKEK